MGIVTRGMQLLCVWTAVAILLVHGSTCPAEEASAPAIKQLMQQQVDAWNRGDIDTFMRGYKDSADTTFIGKSVEHGYAMILARYKRAYPSKDAMGNLEFSEIAARELGAGYAVVTGRYHLARSAAGGGDAGGVFSLVWEKTPEGWKTILDHTSSDKP